MQQPPHRHLFTKPLEPDTPPPPPPRQQRRDRSRRKLHLFSVVRNALALVGLAVLVVELFRWVIIPFVLIPLNGLVGG